MSVVKQMNHHGHVDWSVPSTLPNSLITDLYLGYGRHLGGWLPTAALVELLGEFGVLDRTARSALLRLARAGLLERERRDGRAGYALSNTWLRLMTASDPHRPSVDDGWTMVTYSVPETRRAERHQLRAALTRVGFGNLSPGVWIAPGGMTQLAHEVVRDVDPPGTVAIFTARYEGVGTVTDLVAACWDVDAICAAHAAFVAAHEPVLDRWRCGSGGDDRDAFVDFTSAELDFRRTVAFGFGLPSDVLPRGWYVDESRRILDALSKLVRPRGLRHVMRVAGLRDARRVRSA